MSGYKSVCVRVHLAKSGAYWSCIFTNGKGARTWDRRLHAGQIRDLDIGDGPQAVIPLLEEALRQLRASFPATPARSASAPPPGDMGGLDPRSGDTGPSHLVDAAPPGS